jgi:hypothetical protein
MEANLNHPVVRFYFIYESFFTEYALWHTFTLKVEEKGVLSVLYIERKKETFWNYIENIEVLTEKPRC